MEMNGQIYALITLHPGERNSVATSQRTGSRLDPRTGLIVVQKTIIPVLARNVTVFPCLPPPQPCYKTD